MVKKGKDCSTCLWWNARQYTPTGRPKRDEAGDCSYPIVLPLMPDCVRQDVVIQRSAVWPNNGQNCTCYQRKVKN